MADVGTSERETRTRDREKARLRWIRIASVALLLGALYSYRADQVPRLVRVPMKPLVVSADRLPVRALGAEAGALEGRDLVLITLDTTRPDRLGCYGNGGANTPTLDRLAAEGVLYSNAVATTATTLPTHASILTGLYPHHHGARTNGLHQLTEDRYTIAEALVEKGYDTAAFVSAFVLEKRFGLAQGFAHYDDETAAGAAAGGYAERRGDATTDAAIRWLQQPRSRPYFLWVHYYDPHADYEPPWRYAATAETGYDGELAFVDAQLRRLLAVVEAESDSEPLVVVTADHGEALGEQGERTHGLLVQEATLRIPLIFHSPATLGRGRHVTGRVSQVDLAPTLAALLAADMPNDLDGSDLTKVHDPHRSVLAEAVEGQVSYGWAGLAAIYRGSLKYVDGPNPELFDLDLDPLAANDILSARPDAASALRTQLRALRGADAHIASGMSPLVAGDLAKLEALGYVVTGDRDFGKGRGGPDPRERLPMMNEVLELISQSSTSAPTRWGFLGRLLDGRADADQVIASLERLTERTPDLAPAYHYLASFYEAAGDRAQSERARVRLAEILRERSQLPASP